MSAQSAALAGRAAAGRLMVDTCTITRRSGAPDELTGIAALTTLYAGRCKVQATTAIYEQIAEAGGHSFTEQRLSVHIPVGTFSPKVGDVVTITAAIDTLLLGRAFSVVQISPTKSFATAYRVAVEEVTA